MKSLAILSAAVLAVTSFAADWDGKALSTLRVNKDWAGLETTVITMADTVKTSVSLNVKCAYIQNLVTARCKAGKITAPDAAVKAVDEAAASVALTDVDCIQYCKLLALCRYHGIEAEQVAYDMSKDWTGSRTKAFRGHICRLIGKYSEAYTDFVAGGRYDQACYTAKTLGDAEKIYTSGSTAMAKGVSRAVDAKRIINTVISADYSASNVKSEQIKAFLQSVNRKYSRYLLTDKASWEPILALVRTTLETY